MTSVYSDEMTECSMNSALSDLRPCFKVVL